MDFGAPTHKCGFLIQPMWVEDDPKECAWHASFQVEIHEYRQRARVAYACGAHLGPLIQDLLQHTKTINATLPRWVVTPVRTTT